MSSAVLDRPRVSPPARSRARAAAPRTVAELVGRAWEGIAAHRTVSCPLCGGAMTPRYGAAGAAPVGGRCGDCGTTLG